MSQIKILQLNVTDFSDTGTKKVNEIYITPQGVSEDIHAGTENREVSLVPASQATHKVVEGGVEYACGDLGNNIIVDIDQLGFIKPLDILEHPKVTLQVTQMGRTCNSQACKIFNDLHNCVLPTEAIYAHVIKEGKVKVGESFTHKPYPFKVQLIAVSDGKSQGLVRDKAGDLLATKIQNYFSSYHRIVEVERLVVGDDIIDLEELLEQSKLKHVDVVITIGGTGISNRDITPDIVKNVLDKELTGFMEHIRSIVSEKNPRNLISRGIAGVGNTTLFYTLPGAAHIAANYFDEIAKTLLYAIYMVQGIDRYYREDK